MVHIKDLLFSDNRTKNYKTNKLKDNNNNQKNKSTVKTINDDTVTINKSKIILIKQLLNNIKKNNEILIQILSDFTVDEELKCQVNISCEDSVENYENNQDNSCKIIEGVFDGRDMIGPDGKKYTISANYASKSKLVEGDILKLTITQKGAFIFKQIKPVERVRKIGKLIVDGEGNFAVSDDKHKWRVLTASVTYFKGKIGDEVVILIPRLGISKWAAVENILSRNV